MITINFTQQMDPDFTESAFCLLADPNVNPAGQCINGIFGWHNSNQLLEFTPVGNLDEETNYILTIDTNARNQTGASMPEPFTLAFKTVSTPTATTPTTLKFEGVGCFIQSLEHEKKGVLMRFRDWLSFGL
jgi:hypothetical protein